MSAEESIEKEIYLWEEEIDRLYAAGADGSTPQVLACRALIRDARTRLRKLEHPESPAAALLENCEYEELRAALSDLPTTWYPDLIRAMVEAAYRKKVFKPAGASRFVHDVECRMAEAQRREKGSK